MSKKRFIIFVVVFLSLSSIYFIFHKSNPRPKMIFINETNKHSHDLSFKMSLKLAEDQSGVENALILLSQLPKDQTIEATAQNYFHKLRIGERQNGRGILYLYSKAENLFKVEVSYALEGQIPDVVCHRFEEAAKSFMLSELPQDFISELIITLNIEANKKSDLNSLINSFTQPKWMEEVFLSGGAGVRSQGYDKLKNFNRFIKNISKVDFKYFSPKKTALESVQLYLESLRRGIGDPSLPLLNQGSQVFRFFIPRNEFQQIRTFDYYQKAGGLKVVESGDLALAGFHSGQPILPIVLRKNKAGLWNIDEVKSWTYFHRFENNIEFFPKYDDLPVNSILKKLKPKNYLRPIYSHRVSTPAPFPLDGTLLKTVEQLELSVKKNKSDTNTKIKLAEIYLFELGWWNRAAELYSEVEKIEPKRLEVRWRLYDLYLNLSMAEKSLNELSFLANHMPYDYELQKLNRFYQDEYAKVNNSFQ